MPVVKAIKSKAYFKRYQTKFKRRRQPVVILQRTFLDWTRDPN